MGCGASSTAQSVPLDPVVAGGAPQQPAWLIQQQQALAQVQQQQAMAQVQQQQQLAQIQQQQQVQMQVSIQPPIDDQQSQQQQQQQPLASSHSHNNLTPRGSSLAPNGFGGNAPPSTPLSTNNNSTSAPPFTPPSPSSHGGQLAPLKAPAHLAPIQKTPHAGQLAPLKNTPVPTQSPPTHTKTLAARSSQGASMTIVKCDADPTHIATVTCEECEESFCDACDTTLHAREKTKKHVRRPVGTPSSSSAVNGSPPVTSQPAPVPGPARIVSTSRMSSVSTNQPSSVGRPTSISAIGISTNGSANLTSPPQLKKKGSMMTKAGGGDGGEEKQRPVSGYQRQGSLMQKSSAITSPSVPLAAKDLPPEGKVLNAIPTETLKQMSSSQLNLIWSQYDTDGNGTLDRKELGLLAADCIARTLRMFEEEIKKQNPGISDSSLKAAVEKEKSFMLPNVKKSEDFQKEMVRMLVRKLDVNGDGSVTKQELFMQWNSFSKDLFSMRTDGALACSIM